MENLGVIIEEVLGSLELDNLNVSLEAIREVLLNPPLINNEPVLKREGKNG